MPKRLVRMIVILVSIMALVMVIFVVGFAVIPHFYNLSRLQRFADPFYAYPLPSQTEEVGRFQEYGNFGGAGNHCDFRAQRILITALSEAEIQAYYRDVGFEAVEPGQSPSAAINGLNGLIGVIVRVDDERGTDGRLRVTAEMLDVGYPPVGAGCS